MSEQIQNLESESAKVKLGEVLRAHRMARHTEIPELARTLILSPAQITAIESGTQTSFHNQTFYLRALKKYISYSALDNDEQTNVLFAQIETTLLSHGTKPNANEVSLLITAGLADKRKSYLPQFALKKNRYFWVGLTIVILIGISTFLIQRGTENQTGQTPVIAPIAVDAAKTASTPVQSQSGEKQNTTSPAPLPIAAPNEAALAKSSAPQTANKQQQDSNQNPVSASLKLTFSGPSWVQVVEQNGKRLEKVFTPQDSLELDPSTLASLVIGNARETKLYLNNQIIDLNKHLNAGSGVARFSRQELTGLGEQ